MKIFQHKVLHPNDLDQLEIDFIPEVFFLFASPTFEGTEEFVTRLSDRFENSILIGCSTAGEILGDEVLDSTIVLTAVKFEKTNIIMEEVDLGSYKLDSFSLAEHLAIN